MGIKGCTQKKAWFDEDVGQEWIRQVLVPYVANAEGGAFLLVDHYSVHLTSSFVNDCANIGAEVDYIPGGYTCVLQPVDVGFNGPFKKHIKDQHGEWCLDAYSTCTNDMRLPVPVDENIIEWVNASYEKVSSRTIVKTFLSIGYYVAGMIPETEEDLNILEAATEEEASVVDRDIVFAIPDLPPPAEINIDSFDSIDDSISEQDLFQKY